VNVRDILGLSADIRYMMYSSAEFRIRRIHRGRMTTKPFIQGMRLTISSVTLALSLAHATRRPA
jgi:hypothetical protein